MKDRIITIINYILMFIAIILLTIISIFGFLMLGEASIMSYDESVSNVVIAIFTIIGFILMLGGGFMISYVADLEL